MSFNPAIPPSVIDALLKRLIPLFLFAAGGDRDHAREIARDMLASQNPANTTELLIATQIVTLTVRAIDTAVAAQNPDLPPRDSVRLDMTGARLNREASKSHELLERVREARLTRVPPLRLPYPAYEDPRDAAMQEAIAEATEAMLASRLPGENPAWLQDHDWMQCEDGQTEDTQAEQ